MQRAASANFPSLTDSINKGSTLKIKHMLFGANVGVITSGK
jgi:hypothetical protein